MVSQCPYQILNYGEVMTVKFFGGSISNCGTGIITNKNVDIEIHGDFQIKNCGVGMATYSSSEELQVLSNKAKEHMHEIMELTEKIKLTEPKLRKSVLTSSTVFSALAVGSNTTTVIQFLIDHFPELAKLLS